jgi:DNA-binding beta-propeller fold protein YncE
LVPLMTPISPGTSLAIVTIPATPASIPIRTHYLPRRLSACTEGEVSTLAGSGTIGSSDGTGTSASFNQPAGVKFSPDGLMIAVADRSNNIVRLVVVATGAVSTLAAAASWNLPYDVAWSPDGSQVVVVDTHNNRVRLIAVATQVVTTLAGSGSATYADGTGTAASFNYPKGVAWSSDGSQVAVGDTSNHCVRLIAVATQVVTTLAGSGSATYADGTGTAASFKYPNGVAWSPDGSQVAVADYGNHRVRLIAVATQVVTTLAGSGSATYADGTGTAASIAYLTSVAWSPDGCSIVVADHGTYRVRLIAVATQVVTTLAGSGNLAYADGIGKAASFQTPYGVDWSPDGRYIAVTGQHDLDNHVRLVCSGSVDTCTTPPTASPTDAPTTSPTASPSAAGEGGGGGGPQSTLWSGPVRLYLYHIRRSR